MGKLYNVPTQNNLQYTLASGYSIGGSTLTLNTSASGVVQAPGICVVDRIDTNGNVTATKRTYYSFTGVSSATLSGLSVVDGTDQSHSIGAVVEFVPDVATVGSYYSALTNLVDPTTGSLDTTKVVDLTTAQSLTNKILPSITGASSGTQFTKAYGVYDNGNSGTSKTVDWSKGDRQLLTLTGNVTIDFSNASAGQTLTLYMLQDGTGTRTIAWTPTITWQDAITWGTSYYTTTASKMNIAVIAYVGSAYYGVISKFA